MTAPSADATNLASVVFLRIDGFARQSVAEQVQPCRGADANIWF